MDANLVLALGLGVHTPWRLVDQRLKTGKSPHELHLRVEARVRTVAEPACPQHIGFSGSRLMMPI
jgi:hypothetical protein